MNTMKDQCTITEQSITARLPPTDSFKNLIGFARITEVVLQSGVSSCSICSILATYATDHFFTSGLDYIVRIICGFLLIQYQCLNKAMQEYSR